MGREGDEGEWWRGWIQVWSSVRTFANATMYPYPAQQLIKKRKKKEC
jgi:hypothetical protein